MSGCERNNVKGLRTRADATINVLTLSSVFPKRAEPYYGTFVFERARAVGRLTAVRVLAPLSWVRNGHLNFFRRRKMTPAYEEREELRIWQPLFFYIPRFLKPLDGIAMFLSILPVVLRMNRTEQIELVDAHFVFPEAVAGVLLKKVLGVPLVITLRGKLPVLEQYPLRYRMGTWALRQADEVIAVASTLADRAVELGVRQEQVHVIPNGVDTQRFKVISRTEARRRLGWAATGKLIVAVGHLSALKRFHLIVDAVPSLPPDVRVVIVGGPGPDRDVGPELAQQIEELRLSDRVWLAGALAPEQVMLSVNAADLFVLPSETEGSPNALLEALAVATPVVASRVGGVADCVVEGRNGLLFDPADEAAVAPLIADALAREWDREAIHSLAVLRDWESVAQEVCGVFRRAVSSGRRRCRRRTISG